MAQLLVPQESPQDITSPFAAKNDPIYGVFQESASLRSIASINQDQLVAVGDRGTILVTNDGGRTWSLAPSPTTANLSDVVSDGVSAWAVGGWIGNRFGHSFGVLQKSDDGGVSWRQIPIPSLPRLVGIQLLGSRIVCWGDYCPQLRSSTFESSDGGLTWQAATQGIAHVSAAAYKPDGRWVAVDTLGRSVSTGNKTSLITTPEFPIRAIQGTDEGWLAVGEGGLLISSSDGMNWSNEFLPIPENLQLVCDWHTACVFQDHIWIAGSPGTIAFHSNNGGKSWQRFPTGQNLPIFKLCFIDAQRGWAVGAQGTILATRDSGRTWYVQRRLSERVAILNVNQSPSTTPWPALVAAVWDSQRCVAALALKHAEPLDHADSIPGKEACRVQFARRVGLSDFAFCHSGDDDAQVSELRLALRIATWRPDVLLSTLNVRELYSESEEFPALSVAMQIAQSSEFADTFEPLFVKPWQVAKLVDVVENGRGDYSQQTEKIIRGSGITISDVLSALRPDAAIELSQTNMRTVWSKSQNRSVQTELLGGTIQNSETRIVGSKDTRGNFHSVMGRTHREKMLTQLLRTEESELVLDDWAREFFFFAQSLPTRDTMLVLADLADRLWQKGQIQRSRLVLQWIIRTDPDGDVARWAGIRLLWICFNEKLIADLVKRPTESANSSLDSITQESGSGKTLGPRIGSSPVSTAGTYLLDYDAVSFASPFQDFKVNQDSVADRKQLRGGLSEEFKVVAASAEKPLVAEETSNGTSEREWQFDCQSTVDLILKNLPDLRFEPRFLMLLSHWQKTAGNDLSAQMLLNELIEQPEIVTWHQAALQEWTVLNRQERDWKRNTKVTRATVQPELDGQINEEFWFTGNPMVLESLVNPSRSSSLIHWAYDINYLYIGIVCPRAAGESAPTVVGKRSYDQDLSSIDRVELTLGPNRDYETAFKFTVAENGLTNEAFMNMREFNPKWYVKVHSNTQLWQAEIAVPLKELGGLELRSGESWTVSARRIGPRCQPQSWAQLQTHAPLPQSAGLLQFE